MKVNQLISNIQEHWPAKVICFIMALGLYVLFQVSSLDTKTFIVPLHVSAENGIVPAAPYPAEVKITVRCSKDDVLLLRESDFYAYLNADYLTDDGTYDLHVYTKLSGNALLVDPLEIRISPEAVPLTVEQQVSGYVPVSPLLAGNPAHGYEVKGTVVTPSQIKMTGPHNMVEKYRRLQTKTVSVEGISESQTFDVALETGSSFVRNDDVKTVSVQVTVEPVIIERTFENLPVNLINVPEGLEAKLSVETASLTLTGAQSELEKYAPTGFVFFVNCGSVTSTGIVELPLTVMVPGSFTVSDSVAKTVSVRFTEFVQKRDPAPSEGAEPPAAEDEETESL
ncbi:MAG: hypothetical protein K6G80_06895 [Treponema sp.]|nr:hypothetical protein [Treponema sp.]